MFHFDDLFFHTFQEIIRKREKKCRENCIYIYKRKISRKFYFVAETPDVFGLKPTGYRVLLLSISESGLISEFIIMILRGRGVGRGREGVNLPSPLRGEFR